MLPNNMILSYILRLICKIMLEAKYLLKTNHIQFSDLEKKYINKINDLAFKHNFEVILFTVPLLDTYYSQTKDAYAAANKQLADYCKNLKNITIWKSKTNPEFLDRTYFLDEKKATHNQHTNVKGRTVVSEVVRPDMELRELISQGKGTAVFKYWRKNLGGKTAIEDSYDKMLDGKLSPIDIEDTFGFITPRIT